MPCFTHSALVPKGCKFITPLILMQQFIIVLWFHFWPTVITTERSSKLYHFLVYHIICTPCKLSLHDFERKHDLVVSATLGMFWWKMRKNLNIIPDDQKSPTNFFIRAMFFLKRFAHFFSEIPHCVPQRHHHHIFHNLKRCESFKTTHRHKSWWVLI